MAQQRLKTVQFDPAKYRLVPVMPTDAMLLDLMLLKEWGPVDPEGSNVDQELTLAGYELMMTNLPEPLADDVLEIGDESQKEREARLIESIGALGGVASGAEAMALAEAYRAGIWAPLTTSGDSDDDQAAGTEVVLLRPGMQLGLGHGLQVSQWVEVTAVHAEGFLFHVRNGGWAGEWRTDRTMNAGDGWRPSEVVYVQSVGEELRGDYGPVVEYMEQKLAAGYAVPQLVLQQVSAEEVKAKRRADVLEEEQAF